MINRVEFQRYLVNRRNCEIFHGNDETLCHIVNGRIHIATLGNHGRKEINRAAARRFLNELGFDEGEINEILQEF